jgi:hypothetical protein
MGPVDAAVHQPSLEAPMDPLMRRYEELLGER